MVVGKILGMAGKKLAKKFLSKKSGKTGSPLSKWHYKPTKDRPTVLSKWHYKPTKDRPTVLSKYYKKKKD